MVDCDGGSPRPMLGSDPVGQALACLHIATGEAGQGLPYG